MKDNSKKSKVRSKKHVGKWQYAKLWRKGLTKKQLRERNQLELKGNLVMGELGRYCESRELNVSVIETELGSIVQPLEPTPVWENQNTLLQTGTSLIGQQNYTSNVGSIAGSSTAVHSGDISNNMIPTAITLTYAFPGQDAQTTTFPTYIQEQVLIENVPSKTPSAEPTYTPLHEPISPASPEYLASISPPCIEPKKSSKNPIGDPSRDWYTSGKEVVTPKTSGKEVVTPSTSGTKEGVITSDNNIGVNTEIATLGLSVRDSVQDVEDDEIMIVGEVEGNRIPNDWRIRQVKIEGVKSRYYKGKKKRTGRKNCGVYYKGCGCGAGCNECLV